MGKKGWKKGGNEKEGSSVVTEATRIRVGKLLDEFRLSSDEVYTFESGLSKYDRALIHEMCRKMGMISRSHGKNDKRQLSVYKMKHVSRSRGVETKSCLKFSDETKNILENLFTQFPPDEAEFPEKIPEDSNRYSVKSLGKQDNCFCRLSLGKNEITKKHDTLASKMNGDANHQKVAQDRAKLPIASFKDVITSTVDSHKVVLISGETGCGKTTQVPQYILDHMWSKGEACKIVCTQPRRISAISVAERISFERGENIGDTVGYKIRLESKGGKHSSVMFCTNGVLLRILIGRGVGVPDVKTASRSSRDCILEISHIIVDEIHERDRFSDFMLAILRDLLALYPHLRLILMSATMDAERFSQYFDGCPIIRVPGFTYPVKSFYLEDVLSMLRSTQENHLDVTAISGSDKETHITDDCKASLDESIDLALLSDEIDPLLEVISANVTPKIFDHQHSSTGISPLMVFARKGMVSEVCMLLSLGANCGLKDSDGTTALDWAQREDQNEISEIIKEHMQKDMSKTNDSQELLDKYLATIDPENIDTLLIERLLHKICTDSQDGAILVFLPGWDAINQTREKLLASPFFRDSSKFVILALHSMIPSIEQKKVFREPPAGVRKIILSTNIAETAITIDDVVYVIDCGLMKEKNYDPYNNVSKFYSSWVSKANAKQREGRAGRCQPGICYHLYSKARAASLIDHQVPEIKRMPIEEICLQVKLLDSNYKILDFLQKTLDPPVHEAVHNAILVLQDIGALTHDEKLTELGEKLGVLPVHPLVSKMLFFAILVNCLDPALTLACTADYRDPFVLPIAPEERKRALAAKIEFASLYGGYSDHLTVIAAFDCWRRAKDKGQESLFCSKYFVSAGTMNMLSNMRKQLQNELTKNGFIPKDMLNCSINAQNPGILRAILLAGTYPMVGRMLAPQKNNKKAVVETASGAKVTLHSHSSNFKLSFSKSVDGLLLTYDEITRAEGRMYIKNCSVLSPYPLLLLATEMAVASSNENKCESDEEFSDEEEMEMNVATSGQKEEEIMSSPENNVVVVIDRWLHFESTALDVAQIYCLRQRLKAAILYKVKHPRNALPPALEASVHAIACILSCDGLVGISPPLEDVGHLTSYSSPVPERKASGKKFSNNSNGYLRSLMWDTRPSHPFHSNSMASGSNTSEAGNFRSPYSNAHQKGVGRGSTMKSPSLKRQRGSG